MIRRDNGRRVDPNPSSNPNSQLRSIASCFGFRLQTIACDLPKSGRGDNIDWADIPERCHRIGSREPRLGRDGRIVTDQEFSPSHKAAASNILEPVPDKTPPFSQVAVEIRCVELRKSVGGLFFGAVPILDLIANDALGPPGKTTPS